MIRDRAPVPMHGVRRQLAAQGIGWHWREAIHAIGQKDIGAIADVLGHNPFLMGETATGIDAVTCGVLANIVNVPVARPVKDAAVQRRNLVDFIEGVRGRYFA